MAVFKLEIDHCTYDKLAKIARRERRTVGLQAEVLLMQAIAQALISETKECGSGTTRLADPQTA